MLNAKKRYHTGVYSLPTWLIPKELSCIFCRRFFFLVLSSIKNHIHCTFLDWL